MKTEMRLYYFKAVHEIAEQRPEFFFQLAEDLPDNQQDIFLSINYTKKQLLAKLKSTKGNEMVKKKFFKEKRFEKGIIYQAVLYCAALIGLVVLVVS